MNNDWHWLTRDTGDLPKVGSSVIVYWATDVAEGVTPLVYDELFDGTIGFGESFDGAPISSYWNIKAWQYLPSIPIEGSSDDDSSMLNQRLDRNDNVVTDIMHRLSMLENVALCVAKVFTSFDEAL